MERSVKIGETEYKLKELTTDEGLDFDEVDGKTRVYRMVSKCIVEPKMSIEDLKALPFRLGTALIQAVNELNGLSDFQKPAIKS